MPVSHRHKRRAHKLGSRGPSARKYRITDPTHSPDIKGQFAGVKVHVHGADQFVHLTDAQAQFYVDQGSIELAVDKKPEQHRLEAEHHEDHPRPVPMAKVEER